MTCTKLPTWEAQAPARKREISWGNWKFQFWVPGWGTLVPVTDVSKNPLNGRFSSRLREARRALGSAGSVLIWIVRLIFGVYSVLFALIALHPQPISSSRAEIGQLFTKEKFTYRRIENIAVSKTSSNAENLFLIRDRNDIFNRKRLPTGINSVFKDVFLPRIDNVTSFKVIRGLDVIRLNYSIAGVLQSIRFEDGWGLPVVFYYNSHNRILQLYCKAVLLLGKIKTDKDESWNGDAHCSLSRYFSGNGIQGSGIGRYSRGIGALFGDQTSQLHFCKLLLHPTSLRFHPFGLLVDIDASLIKKNRLPNHRANLQYADYRQDSCKPFEFTLYEEIPAALLASLIACWGGWLLAGGHRAWGGLLITLGLVLVSSVLTTAGFCDPLFGGLSGAL